jgi:mRNA interferase MazF
LERRFGKWYITYPKRGDFVALSFDPQSGHEQKGRRPALVVSNDLFKQRTGLAIVCPITNTDRNVPFHVKIPESWTSRPK